MIELFNGDCMDILKEIPDNSVDLVVTDPPYMLVSGGDGANRLQSEMRKTVNSLKKADMANGYDIQKTGMELLRILKEPNLYFRCSKKQLPEYMAFYVKELKCTFDIICWHKTNALPTYSNKYLSDTEYLLYFRKGKGKCFPQSYDDAKTYYIAPINLKDKKQYGHPTIKPLDITEKIIRNSTREGQTVCDPFMGSGTTGVACVNLNRNFVGIEIDEEYFQTALKRTGSEKC